MNLRIISEELEIQEENRRNSVLYEIQDALKQADFLCDRYRQRLKAVERRKRNLIHTSVIFACVALGLLLLAALVGNLAAAEFGIWAVGLFIGLSSFVILGFAKVLISYGIHSGILPRRKVYTLKEEEQDLHHFMKRLEDARRRMEDFLNQEHQSEAAGRQLLKEIEPELTEKERHADYLYGESDNLSL